MMRAYEEAFSVPAVAENVGLLGHIRNVVKSRLREGLLPIRLAITCTTQSGYECELGVIDGIPDHLLEHAVDMFEFRHRTVENCSTFTAALVIPTGIGAELGGHAGDANPAARLLASVCDTLITHPNVVNASDVNELPDNGLYVEGSIISRLLMGAVGLQPVRANRVLTVIDAHPDEYFRNVAINAVGAARSSYALNCPLTVVLDPPVRLEAEYASSGRAMGHADNLEGLLALLDRQRDNFDALAISTQIQVPASYHTDYYLQRGAMINPWGGVEAIFTHALATLYNIPTAHAPMEMSQDISNEDRGVVDPRMAAEIISTSYFLCVLKGLQRAPRVIVNPSAANRPGVLTVEDISCLVIPDGCIGVPTLAALEQGIPVIAVRENRNIMKNDLKALPWRPDQLRIVDNYWEAAGVIAALKSGLDPVAVRRPLADSTYRVND